jgi:hypothetical protein
MTKFTLAHRLASSQGLAAVASLSIICAAVLSACGGGGSSDTAPMSTAQSAQVPVLISDASSEDWSLIGVRILSITLTPQGGGAPVTVYTAPMGGTALNLAQLDQLSELLGNLSIPEGTYTGATLTISANPGDVELTVSADPEQGFAEAAGTNIPSARIQIQGATGATGNRTVPVTVKFEAPLVVSSSQSNALELEVDLSHPSFLIGHVPPTGGGATLWAVNFRGPLHHHRIDDITQLVLRHAYGTVTSVAGDNTSFTITKDLPALPVTTPETAVATNQSLTYLADAANGTLVYDLDAKTSTTLKDFSSLASTLSGKYVRVAARYQENGTLVAVRVYTSTSFNTVWLSPEGHVLHVDTAANKLTVVDETGHADAVSVDANTKFYFRTPENALTDATPIGIGTAFLANLARGFKVHVQLVDPLAATWVAQSVDIETAAFNGKISGATTSSFAYTRSFSTASDDYSVTLPYIASASANGKDANGNAITGFKYWNFAYPTLVDSGAHAISDYVAATSGSVNFGGTVGALSAHGVSYTRWGDPAAPAGWSAPWTVLQPTPLPRGTVESMLSASNMFTMSLAGGTTPATISVNTSTGSTTLVYQVDRTEGVVTVSPQDVSTAAGLAALTAALSVNAPVKVYGIPQPDGTLKAYEITYFTGVLPQ